MADQRSLDKISSSEKGKAGGVCPLGEDGKVPAKYVGAQSSGGIPLDQSGYIPAQYIRQGTGSGLNAELLDGKPSSDFAGADTNIAVNYPLQGGGDLRSGRVVISLAEDVLNGALDHTKLRNIGTNTHAQIDTFVAKATVTPAAGAIPIADSKGTLDAWVTGEEIDHGALSGLSDDDHTIYAKADGSRAFTGVPSCAVAPTTGNHLTNKTYIDNLIAASGSGDVVGPGSAIANRIAIFDGTTGKVIADGGVLVSDLAVAAKGVTNGDSHDHSGGDGAQIAHTALTAIGTNTHAQIDTHVASTSNPHTVTKAQVGLGSCDNTSDASKPVSTAQQTALDGKVSHSLATAANDVLVASGVGAFVKKTLAELKTILGLGTAAYTASTDYAVAAKGVTNGDSHDHAGGDGGTIAYSSLSGLPTLPVTGSATPLALGTAAVGVATGSSHEDHVHPTTGLMLTTHAANSVTGFGTEPAAVSTSTSGTAGVATTVSRGDHGHDLGAHAHTGATDGGGLAYLGLSVTSEVSVTGATTLTSTAFGKMHVCTGTAADYTVGLPAASGNAGKIIALRIGNACTKLVTLDANASELIDGATTRVMWAGESAILLCDGSGWTKIAGKSIPMQCQLSATSSQSIASGTYTTLRMDSVVFDNGGISVLASNKITTKRGNIYNLYAWSEITAYIAYNLILAINPWRFATSAGQAFTSTAATGKLDKGQDFSVLLNQGSGSNVTTAVSYAGILVSEVVSW